MISWVAMDRIMKRKTRSDADCRKQAARKVACVRMRAAHQYGPGVFSNLALWCCNSERDERSLGTHEVVEIGMSPRLVGRPLERAGLSPRFKQPLEKIARMQELREKADPPQTGSRGIARAYSASRARSGSRNGLISFEFAASGRAVFAHGCGAEASPAGSQTPAILLI